MAGVRSPWHALRPVFLAGAATFAWLTFSSSPASADLLPEPAPAVSGVTADVPATDLLAPVVDTVPGTAATDPVAPITGGVGDAVEAVHQVAEPPVSGFIEPVIDPVVEYVEPVLEPAEPLLDPVLAPVAQPVANLSPVLEPVLRLAPPAPVQAVVGLLSSQAAETAAAAPAVSASTAGDGSAPVQQAPAGSAPQVALQPFRRTPLPGRPPPPRYWPAPSQRRARTPRPCRRRPRPLPCPRRRVRAVQRPADLRPARPRG